MGFFSSVAKGIKGLVKGIGKVFKAVIRSPVGIAALAAGAYLFGGALGAWDTPFDSINGAWTSQAASGLAGSDSAASQLIGAGGADTLTGGGADSMINPNGLIENSMGNQPATVPGTPQFQETMGFSQPQDAVSAPVSAPAPSMARTALDTGSDIIKDATKWLSNNPVPALIMGNMMNSAFSPSQIDVQDNAAKKQMELEDWRRQYAAQNTNVGLISTRMKPSGKPLQTISPNPSMPYPLKG